MSAVAWEGRGSLRGWCGLADKVWSVFAAIEETGSDETIIEKITQPIREAAGEPGGQGPVAGAGRGEVSFRNLNVQEQKDMEDAMLKQIKQHTDLMAIQGVPVEESVPKAKELPSRVILTLREGTSNAVGHRRTSGARRRGLPRIQPHGYACQPFFGAVLDGPARMVGHGL